MYNELPGLGLGYSATGTTTQKDHDIGATKASCGSAPRCSAIHYLSCCSACRFTIPLPHEDQGILVPIPSLPSQMRPTPTRSKSNLVVVVRSATIPETEFILSFPAPDPTSYSFDVSAGALRTLPAPFNSARLADVVL
jgi:hypothetical protein